MEKLLEILTAATDEHLLAALEEINADSQPCVASIETKMLFGDVPLGFHGLGFTERRNYIYDGIKTECSRRWQLMLKKQICFANQ